MKEKILVHNVVASYKADSKIPLSRLAMKLEGTEYEPEQFPGLVLRISEIGAAALIFRTGKIVCTGTKSSKQAKAAIEKVMEKIKDLGVPVSKVDKVVIQNIVASTQLGKNMDLNAIAFGLEGTEYEPEQFPGLVLRMNDSSIVFLLFSSGKVICTGGKNRKMIEESVGKLKKNLRSIGVL